MARAVASLALAILVVACGGFGPDAGTGPIVDIAGVGSATLVQLEPPSADEDQGMWSWRWTGARTILPADGGQLLVVWAGGPSKCWVAGRVHLDARGNSLAASVGERPAAPEGRPCDGDRALRAVLVPDVATPRIGDVSDWPPVAVDPNAQERP